MKKVNYQEALALGFKRIEIDDAVHFDENGWKYFVLSKIELDGTKLEWCPVDKKIRHYTNEGDLIQEFSKELFHKQVESKVKFLLDKFDVKQNRKRKNVMKRQALHIWLYENTWMSLTAIGQLVGGQDHSTVVHSRTKVIIDDLFLSETHEIMAEMKELEKFGRKVNQKLK